MAKFEVVSRFDNANLILPARATKCSAGYDFKQQKRKLSLHMNAWYMT